MLSRPNQRNSHSQQNSYADLNPKSMLQNVSLNRQFNNTSSKKGQSYDVQAQSVTLDHDRRSQTSSKVNMQFGSSRAGAAGHKEYLRNMLINKLLKKFPDADYLMKSTIESEVNLFISSEYVTKESMKQLEARVARKLNLNYTSV